MKQPLIISAILAVTFTAIESLMLTMSQIVSTDNIVSFIILSALLHFAVLFIVFHYLIYKELHALIGMFEALRHSRVEDLKIKKSGMRLNVFKKTYKLIYRLFYRNQKKVDQLTKLAAFRKEFIADVSHELKTPLFAAQGFVHTLIDGAVQDKSVRTRFLEKAAKSLDGLDLLVQDLLTLSHIEIGETKMQFEYFDLGGLVDEVVDQFESRAGKRGIKFVVERDDTPLIVYADWFRIKQVVTNLMSNAMKYSHDDGEVLLTFDHNKESVLVTVKDEGIGIPPSDLDRVFERFYRVDKSRSRERGGTGLGLAIVKHILESHNCKIEVESEVGKGTVFTFSLPKGKD